MPGSATTAGRGRRWSTWATCSTAAPTRAGWSSSSWPDRPRAGTGWWSRATTTAAAETLASYGVAEAERRDLDTVHAEALRKVPVAHARWLDALPGWHLTPLALFVHAGIRPGIDLREQTEDDLTWLRRPFHDDPRDHGVLVVHGHTPVRRATHYGNRVNIDTGAAYGGALTAIRIDADGVWVLDDAGPRRLTPGATDRE